MNEKELKILESEGEEELNEVGTGEEKGDCCD